MNSLGLSIFFFTFLFFLYLPWYTGVVQALYLGQKAEQDKGMDWIGLDGRIFCLEIPPQLRFTIMTRANLKKKFKKYPLNDAFFSSPSVPHSMPRRKGTKNAKNPTLHAYGSTPLSS